MTFPVYLDFFGWRVHPHPFFEVIAYAGGFQIYLAQRRRLRREGRSPAVNDEKTLSVLIGAVFGALVGAKLLAWWEQPPDLLAANVATVPALFPWLAGGKTIVGGLLGGWLGVELAKWGSGIKVSTGDAFVMPLIFGMAVGRIGCFLTGLADRTHGLATSLPWGVNLGDGISRHPTALYEIGFLLALAVFLRAMAPRLAGLGSGARFRVFIGCYAAFRFGIDFLKPRHPVFAGLSAIQVACMLAVILCLVLLLRTPPKTEILHQPVGT